MTDDVDLLNEIWFAPEDQRLFSADNLDLRASALRHSILPDCT